MCKSAYLITNFPFFLIKITANCKQPSLAAQPTTSTLQTSLTAKISALRVPRSIRTRGVTIAECDPVVERTVRIAGILREICEELNSFKGKKIFIFKKNSRYFTHCSLNHFRRLRPVCNIQVKLAIEEKVSAIL